MSERFVTKFLWSRPAALRLAREIGVLTALVRVPLVPLLPGAVASSTRPPLLITKRVPGSLCSRSSTRSTGIVQAGASRSSWRHRTSRQPRTCRGRRRQAHRHAVPQTTIKYPARPVWELGLAGSAPGVARWCEWATPRWPVPPKPLRPLPGQQAAAPQRSSRALTCLPGHGASLVSRRRLGRRRAPVVRSGPAGNAVSLTRRCLRLRPTADQGAARVSGQGAARACDRRNAPARRATLRGSRTSS